jgi:hypothetical protein
VVHKTARVLTTVEVWLFCASKRSFLQHSKPGRKRSHKSSGSPQSVSEGAAPCIMYDFTDSTLALEWLQADVQKSQVRQFDLISKTAFDSMSKQ